MRKDAFSLYLVSSNSLVLNLPVFQMLSGSLGTTLVSKAFVCWDCRPYFSFSMLHAEKHMLKTSKSLGSRLLTQAICQRGSDSGRKTYQREADSLDDLWTLRNELTSVVSNVRFLSYAVGETRLALLTCLFVIAVWLSVRALPVLVCDVGLT